MMQDEHNETVDVTAVVYRFEEEMDAAGFIFAVGCMTIDPDSNLSSAAEGVQSTTRVRRDTLTRPRHPLRLTEE